MRAILLLGLLACTTDPEPAPRPDEPKADGVPYWGPSGIYDEETQCKHLLGRDADTLTDRASGQGYISFPLETIDGQAVSISPAGLSIANGTLAGKELKKGTNNVSLLIDTIGSNSFGATYTLKYKGSTDLDWKDYCEPGEVATALRGEWNSTAFRVSAPRVTFGCSDAAMAKCYGFGYVPAQQITNLASQTAWRAHQACTRMARADICGDGESYTRPETPIVIRDYLVGAFNPPPVSMLGDPLPAGVARAYWAPSDLPPPDRHFYESAWTWEEGRGAVCLARMRWKSVGKLECPNLTNPRLDKTARFCEELGNEGITSLDGMLVNLSKTQDMNMLIWRNPATGDTVTTVRGFWREDHGDPEPFPGSGYTKWVEDDGILLRNPPYSLTPNDVVPVYSSFASPADRALLPDPNLDETDPTFEGYMLKFRKGVGLRSLGVYERIKKDGTKETNTSIQPDESGWTKNRDLESVLTDPTETIPPIE